jgi:hypothetical protein
LIESGTTLTTFNPKAIPYQYQVIKLIRKDWNYDDGNPEILLSGSYGSAKSILMAHLAITHCLNNSRAVVLLARKALPDLKDTIFKEILEHLEGELIEGVDYWVNANNAKITFSNGSMMISRSWSDKKYKKSRSLKISMAVFEELTENNEEDKEAFMTIKARLRRLPHVKENVLICATNPDDPSHWVFEYFFNREKKTRFVFKSVTTDNPFLDPQYIKQLKDDLDPLSAQRYIYGEWVSLFKDRIYYAYDRERNYIDKPYVWRTDLPVAIMHDFNIGKGKPMSSAIGQEIDGVFHVAKPFHVEGARTGDIIEEMIPHIMWAKHIKVYGDASGKNNDTRSKRSDYDIIQKALENLSSKPIVEMCVPLANPPIRRRHNLANSLFISESGKVKFFLYQGCEWIDKGLRLTKLLSGANAVEDDSLAEQHVTTAVFYWADYVVNRQPSKPRISHY